MIFQILENGLSLWQNLILIAVMVATVLFSMSIHEYAHGYVSYMLGDDTAKRMGRLTLNPIKHISPLGLICMLFCGFGWAKPVPIDARKYRKPKLGTALTAISGPIINLLIGIWATATLSMVYFIWANGFNTAMPVLKYVTEPVYQTVYMSLYIVLYYNLLFAVFNMFVLPPFDGSRVLYAFLPDRIYFGIMRYEKIIMLVLFILLWTGMFTNFFDSFVDVIIRGVSEMVFLENDILCRLILAILTKGQNI